MTRLYLDHNATSPLRPSAQFVLQQLHGKPLNASSVHAEGRFAMAQLEKARLDFAQYLSAPHQGVIFTGGGSEACNQAIKAWRAEVRPFQRILVSAIEHEAVLKSANDSGLDVGVLKTGTDGTIDLNDLAQQLDGPPALVCVMLANNETGVIQPITEVCRLTKENDGLVFCDATQAVGKMEVSFIGLGVDMLAVSAHKFGGPVGVGALIIHPSLAIAPLIAGGGQELGRRSGTQNVAAIIAMVAALEEAITELPLFAQLSAVRDALEVGLKEHCSAIRIMGEGAPRLANTSCFAVPFSKAETLLMGLDLAGISISSGSACSSGKVARSHVLESMGVDASVSQAALRVSLGRENTVQDMNVFLNAWKKEMGRQIASAAE